MLKIIFPRFCIFGSQSLFQKIIYFLFLLFFWKSRMIKINIYVPKINLNLEESLTYYYKKNNRYLPNKSEKKLWKWMETITHIRINNVKTSQFPYKNIEVCSLFQVVTIDLQCIRRITLKIAEVSKSDINIKLQGRWIFSKNRVPEQNFKFLQIL